MTQFNSSSFTNPEYELIAIHPEHFLPYGNVLPVFHSGSSTPTIYVLARDRCLRKSPEPDTSVNIQISFRSFGPFRHFFAGMPAHKLVQAINYLKERKPEAQKNQTDIKDIYKWLI
jgi:hypothetical protein